jgi:hypothetical protein
MLGVDNTLLTKARVDRPKLRTRSLFDDLVDLHESFDLPELSVPVLTPSDIDLEPIEIDKDDLIGPDGNLRRITLKTERNIHQRHPTRENIERGGFKFDL